jgi:hypothetical protein
MTTKSWIGSAAMGFVIALVAIAVVGNTGLKQYFIK